MHCTCQGCEKEREEYVYEGDCEPVITQVSIPSLCILDTVLTLTAGMNELRIWIRISVKVNSV
jgi:hypothetical protein